MQQKHSKFFVGPGKLEEIKKYVENENIDIVIFDDELTPAQIRNIETIIECKIIDRTNLILDIFAKRAQTAQAKTQVELAQCEYLLPRLTRLWTHLSRQKGGIGMKGPGEKEIETDRRIIRTKIKLLKDKLKLIDQQNVTRRKSRSEKIRISLVGYTNAGKSTLMNRLSDATVLAENKLFATLDTTIRKVVINNMPFLLSDTVGFIRKLPHTLIESFKSTLDEVREADILIHVVDISHTDYKNQLKVVNATLKELGVEDKRTIVVFNKIDQYIIQDEDMVEIKSLDDKENYLQKAFLGEYPDMIFISASLNYNLQALRTKLYEMAKEEYLKMYPYSEGEFFV